MSVLLICTGRDPQVWVNAIREQQPNVKLYVYPEAHDPKEITYAVTWRHPKRVFNKYPNLKVIASIGAGVDHIICDPEIPKSALVTRVIDEQLTKDMSTFVLALVLDKIRNISLHHSEKKWGPKPYQTVEEENIGIMGLGVLGKSAALNLSKNGFKVSGWSKTKKHIDGVSTYHGERDLNDFLKNTSILICLLPLTLETECILNKELFEKLPKGAYLINVARGEHLVEHDLLEMLDKNHLSGASLDVFRIEPLPQEHPFWKHPNIQITPHIASITDPKNAVNQLLDNYNRMLANKPLNNIVELKKGY
ncbi:glyoxylate/hydroxypyruvate reductase A [Gillisia sp. Hel_I_86]|uniref:2-hydroxyacid dehydrogenase n=1 Tax=Gillisia sp. Hel_I_86 TaxID=1249981 RepID=UPI00119C174D|nr:glyoxylate/hydroxypyruvate reductase A [Gillisia sp. Hel_I_86]TVZ27227.1 glyoxylate/hydroxypyruvate reductase A [Gillisia sp. Hel_I_86]